VSFNIKILQHPDYGPIVRALLQEIENPDSGLSSSLKERWFQAITDFSNDPDPAKLVELTKWRRSIVPLDEFLFSNEYLGLEERQTFPAVLEACQELDTDKYTEAVLLGAIGSGKTSISNYMILRTIYKISCMRQPQLTFGLQPKSAIVLTIQSVKLGTAKKAVFEELGALIDNSTYFRNIYPYDKRIKSQLIFKENRVSILPVTSSISGAISMNVIAGILDEANFMQKIKNSKSANADDTGMYDQAKQLYNTLARRRKSRFNQKGKLPGTLFVVSSSRYPDDFTQLKAKESASWGGKDPTIYVYNKSQWEAKGRDRFMTESFRVQVGNAYVSPKILAPGEQPMHGSEVVDVPMDFYSEFEKDCSGALRDYAGLTVLSSSPFFTRRETINQCMELADKLGYKPLFNTEVLDLSMGIPRPYESRLRLDVDQPRACHIDLGLKKDACGLCIGHIAGSKMIERYDPISKAKTIEILPLIGIDLAIRIVPPPGGEIEFANIRRLITILRDEYRLPIKYITTDGFQSVDTRQILRKQGFFCDYLSVEKIEPYRTFRDAIYDNRVILPQNEFLKQEMVRLERVIVNNRERTDHPANFCFTGDTVVKMLDGNNKTMKELADMGTEHRFWVYACKPDGTIVPALAHNAHKTMVATSLCKVTLDNGRSIKCTPDHRFMLRNGMYKKAKDLNAGDSLMPMRWRKYGNYEIMWDNKTNKEIATHRMVYMFFNGPYDQNNEVIHHYDINPRNNTPENLKLLTREEHAKVHSRLNKLGSTKIAERTASFKRNYRKKLGLPENCPVTYGDIVRFIGKKFRATPEQVEKRRLANIENCRSPERRALSKERAAYLNGTYWKTPEGVARRAELSKTQLREASAMYDEQRKLRRKAMYDSIPKPINIAYALSYNHLAKRLGLPKKTGGRALQENMQIDFKAKLIAEFSGKTKKEIATLAGTSVNQVEHYLKQQNLLYLIKGPEYNHKVVSVELIEGVQEDVYDITVPGYNNFALYNGVFVHNSKDVCDAVCGVCNFLLTRKASWTNMDINPNTGMCFLGDPQFNTDIKKDYGDLSYSSGAALIRKTPVRKMIIRKETSRK